MRSVDKDKLGIALKGANEAVRDFFLKNMSSRAAKMLMDDMAAIGPVRLRDVDEAQPLLVNLAKDWPPRERSPDPEARSKKSWCIDGLAREIPVRRRLRAPDRRASVPQLQPKLRRRSRRPKHAPIARATRRPARGQSRERPQFGDGAGRDRQRLQGIAASFCGMEGKLEAEAVELAVAVANKLAANCGPRANRRDHGAGHDCFSHLVATPHLVVRINDQLYEAARANIERQAAQSGFEGRLVILAEPGIPHGDCRIEWADGGVVLERATNEAKISELVGRYLASRDQAEL